MSKSWCFYIPMDHRSFDEGEGWVPSIVERGKPGHSPLRGNGSFARPYYWGMTYEEACERARWENEQIGVSPEEALEIITSSMAAGPVQR